MSEKTYKPVLISSITAKTDIKKCRFIGFDGNYCTAGVKAYGISDVETDKEEMLQKLLLMLKVELLLLLTVKNVMAMLLMRLQPQANLSELLEVYKWITARSKI